MGPIRTATTVGILRQDSAITGKSRLSSWRGDQFHKHAAASRHCAALIGRAGWCGRGSSFNLLFASWLMSVKLELDVLIEAGPRIEAGGLT